MREEILGRDEILGNLDEEEIVGLEEILGRDEILGREEILGRDEILGREEILGRDEILGWNPFKKIYRGVKKGLSPLDPRWQQILASAAMHGAFVGDDERALAAEGGSAEREALERRTSLRGRRGLVSGWNSKWQYMQGDDALDEILGRDEILGASPIVDGLPHPNPLTAEQKEDIRTYLRHLPAMSQSQEADHERMVAQLREKFGEVKERARAGDARALERWEDIVKWTNKLQEGALKNDANALTHLRNISRTGIFNPRFRVAGERASWEYTDELGAPPRLLPAPRRVDPAKVEIANAKVRKLTKMQAADMSRWIDNYGKKNGFVTSQMLEDKVAASRKARVRGSRHPDDVVRRNIINNYAQRGIQVRG
jgi:hypothetical protein